jgi:endo-1,4-beta-xylanase
MSYHSQQSQPRLLFSCLVLLLSFILNGCDLDGEPPSSSDPAPAPAPAQGNNQQPIARINGTLVYDSGETVTLDGSNSSDPDGDTLSYKWTKTEGPDTVLAEALTPTLSFVAPTVSQTTRFIYELTVWDGELSSTTSVNIRVLSSDPNMPSNQQPSARITAPQSAISGQVVTLSSSGSSDPDGYPLSYQWIQKAGPAITLDDNTSSSLTFVAPSVSQPQQISFQLTVSDGELSNSTDVSMLISPVVDNGAPSITSIFPQPGQSEVSPVAQIHIGFDKALLASSVNSQSLVVSQNGSQVPGSVSYDSSRYSVTFKPTSALTAGVSYTVTLTQAIADRAGNAFAGTSWSFTTGVCGTAEEDTSLTLSCPGGQVINEVTFASYGTPGGSCGSFTTGACSASNSITVVSDTCKGMDTCTLKASNETFGDPCNGKVKVLAAQVVCSMASDATPNPTPTPAPTPDNNTGVTSLKSLVSFPVGVAVNAGNEADSIISSGTSSQQQAVVLPHFNQMTAGNIMKMSYLHPSENSFTFDQADAFVSFAAANGLAVHAHTLVWHSDYQVPSFMKNYSGDFKAMLKKHVQTIASHYAGKVDSWDVVNEALADNGESGAVNGFRNSVFYQKMGVNFIDQAFINARAADPNADLFYNDYSIENGDAKTNNMLSLVDGLKARNVPISGVGFQMHVLSDWPNTSTIEAAMKAVADRGLKVKISELDVRVNNPYNSSATVYTSLTAEAANKQKERYRQIVAAYLRAVPPAQRAGITVWGVWDANSWLNTPQNPDWPLLFDDNFKAKPALQGFADGLAGR